MHYMYIVITLYTLYVLSGFKPSQSLVSNYISRRTYSYSTQF